MMRKLDDSMLRRIICNTIYSETFQPHWQREDISIFLGANFYDAVSSDRSSETHEEEVFVFFPTYHFNRTGQARTMELCEVRYES